MQRVIDANDGITGYTSLLYEKMDGMTISQLEKYDALLNEISEIGPIYDADEETLKKLKVLRQDLKALWLSAGSM